MTSIEIRRSIQLPDIGNWLETRFPNPPLPDTQRWSIIRLKDGSERWGISFQDEKEASMFCIAWGDRI
jgi:hypothetical protein